MTAWAARGNGYRRGATARRPGRTTRNRPVVDLRCVGLKATLGDNGKRAVADPATTLFHGVKGREEGSQRRRETT